MTQLPLEQHRSNSPGPPQIASAVVAIAMVWSVVAIGAPIAVTVGVPLVLARTTPSPGRWLLLTTALGWAFTLYGAEGTFGFLNTFAISTQTLMSSLVFVCALCAGIVIASSVGRVRAARAGQLAPGWHRLLLVCALALLAYRFRDGIPLVLGDQARLAAVAAVGPTVGLLSGVVPIAAAFARSHASATTRLLQFLLVLAVLGTASRLLVLAVVVGIGTQFYAANRDRAASRWLIGLGVLLAVTSVVAVYSVRTSAPVEQTASGKTAATSGVAGRLNDILGPSVQLAARNGLAVSERARTENLKPPRGFIWGAFLHNARLSEDPERWLTGALGLRLDRVGAIATPIWSGATIDGGRLGGLLVGLAVGLVLTWLAGWRRDLTLWACFGLLLSFYGSYVVSTQFVYATVALLVIGTVSTDRATAHERQLSVAAPHA